MVAGPIAAAPAGTVLQVGGSPLSAAEDPYLEQQWGLERINAPQVWPTSRGEGIVVAVVDSGVALDHPDLADAIARGPDGHVLGLDLLDGGDPTDAHGHGTMIAGIVAARADDGLGVVGVAPLASIMPLRVLDEDAAGRSRDVDEAIRWAVDHGADVINLSLELGRDGEGVRDDRAAPVEAVRHAWEQGVIVVAAAGNEGSDATDFPDDAPVLVVGATDREDRLAPFSDVGRSDALLAPGVEVVSAWCQPCGAEATHTVGVSDGTSYAAAHVSGALALLLGAGVSPSDAVRHLRGTAVGTGSSGPDTDHGRGRIDVAAAMEAAGVDTDGDAEPPLVVDSRADATRYGAAAVAALLLVVNIAALLRWRRRGSA